MNNEQENLLDHEYDGIRELDNKLPRWWVWLFYASIIFAGVYLGYYHVIAKGDLAKNGQMLTEYNHEMQIGNALKAAATTKFEASIPTLQPSKDPIVIEQGHQMFLRLCAPCHRADGGGLVSAALHPIEGGEQVARYLAALVGRLPRLTITERTVNGQPGLVAEQDGAVVTVFAFDVAADQIARIWIIRNPNKLTRWVNQAD